MKGTAFSIFRFLCGKSGAQSFSNFASSQEYNNRYQNLNACVKDPPDMSRRKARCRQGMDVKTGQNLNVTRRRRRAGWPVGPLDGQAAIPSKCPHICSLVYISVVCQRGKATRKFDVIAALVHKLFTKRDSCQRPRPTRLECEKVHRSQLVQRTRWK